MIRARRASTQAGARSVLGVAVLVAVAALGAVRGDAAYQQPLRVNRLSTDQGLSQGTVLCLFQDSRGFIWVGTEDGLNRYDGYTFTQFEHDANNPGSLASDVVWAIAEDAAGYLWIATDDGGLHRFDPSDETFLRVGVRSSESAGTASALIRALWIEDDRAIWVGTRDAGLDRVSLDTLAVTHFHHDDEDPASLIDDSIYALWGDQQGHLWVGTDQGLCRLETTTGAITRYAHDPAQRTSLSDNQVRSVFGDRHGFVWIGTYRGGLNRLDPASGRVTRFRHDPGKPASLSDDRVRAILEDDRGNLWVGTGSGLNLFDPSTASFTAYRHDPADPWSLSDNYIMCMAQDRGGVIWIGTRFGGISRWSPATWSFGHHSMATHGLSADQVLAFAQTDDRTLWVGTFGGGLNRLDRVAGRTSHFRHDPRNPASLSSDRVTVLLLDEQQALWIGTLDGGLNRLRPGSKVFTSFRHTPGVSGSISSDGIMSLCEDSAGRLWIGTFGGGLNRFNEDEERFTVLRHDPQDPWSLGADRVTALARDDAGVLWVGTEGGGLSRLSSNLRSFVTFRHLPGDPRSLPSDLVCALHVPSTGGLWVGTRGGGAAFLDPSQVARNEASFVTFSKREGLSNDVVYGVLTDDRGFVWMSTNQGLSRLDMSAKTFTNFDVSHGLQGNEFNFGAAYKGLGGELFFGGVNGFNAFYPDQIKSNPHVPPVVLTGFAKLNQPVVEAGPPSQLSSVELTYRDKLVTFEFAALDFAAPQRNQYRYRLEGFDDAWVELGSFRRISYTNLDPGRYVLKVQGSNNDRVWNTEGLALAVKVQPAPWQTVWAYLVYALVVVAIIGAYVRSQRRALQREMEYGRRLEQEVQARTGELAVKNRQLVEANRQLKEASLTDSLTGLWNRRFFYERVMEETELVRRRYAHHSPDDPLTPNADVLFVMIDLDGFKAMNDAFGHPAGDDLLLQIRDLLAKACRKSDLLVRWGGDEFLVVGRDVEVAESEALAERVRVAIEGATLRLADGRTATTTCSIGLSGYPLVRHEPELCGWEEILQLADSALYLAKSNGGNAWVSFVGTGLRPTREQLARLRVEPEKLVGEGVLEIRTSLRDLR